VRSNTRGGVLLLKWSPLLLPALLILIEFAFFLGTVHPDPVREKADMIAVFTGEGARIEHGFDLANQDFGSILLISRASDQSLKRYEKRLKRATFECIAEDEARNTFENALYTKRIMRERGVHSIILVTSWDHLPRSYLLLRILTLRSGVRIQVSSVPTGGIDSVNWYRHAVGWKRAYNEMMETWGSLYELASYAITGRLPYRVPSYSGLVKFLRRILLFDLESVRTTESEPDIKDTKAASHGEYRVVAVKASSQAVA
jgi:uncharacterized SAM-binding protein YcdF (DUF218 family)